MNALPEKLYLRRGEVRNYLALSEQAMTKMLRAGGLKPVYLPGMKWAFYERAQVEQVKAERFPRTNLTNHKETK